MVKYAKYVPFFTTEVMPGAWSTVHAQHDLEHNNISFLTCSERTGTKANGVLSGTRNKIESKMIEWLRDRGMDLSMSLDPT